jgi:hypothetical protein
MVFITAYKSSSTLSRTTGQNAVSMRRCYKFLYPPKTNQAVNGYGNFQKTLR